MRIAIIGYGKMGKEIEKSAIARGHEIVLKLSSSDISSVRPDDLKVADVAIEFTVPDAAVSNIQLCFQAGIPIVTGTTGWYAHLGTIRELCLRNNYSMLHASNFSPGVNILFEINRRLATLMNTRPEYDVAIEEIHHLQKKDAPSGTAITLANDIVDEQDGLESWVLENEKKDSAGGNQLPILSKRLGNVTGTHIIKYQSNNDSIELRHEAFNRNGFADGAVLASEWIIGKKGFYTMEDVLNLKS